MKKITMLILVLTITTASAWEINTHRAIDRIAIEKSVHLQLCIDTKIGGVRWQV